MKAPITFAIAGFGDRGSTYASMQRLFPDRMKVVAVADLDPRKVEKARQLRLVQIISVAHRQCDAGKGYVQRVLVAHGIQF